MTNDRKNQSVAVIGTGISGLSTAWALAREGYSVTLFGKEERLGGHSLTYPGEGNRPAVDLGFQVFNLTTYPYLTQFFEELGVEHEPSDMSFALSVDDGRVEWASHGIGSVFAQKKNAASPSFLRMMREVMRFGKESVKVLENKQANEELTLGEYLDANGYSERFRNEYLLPTCAAVWSVPNKQMLEFPVVPLIAFMANHHLLNPLGDRPRWRVVKGRSEQYVCRVAESLKEMGATMRLGSGVSKVVKQSGKDAKVTVETEDGSSATFDHVVLACHSDTAAAMLEGEGTKQDKDLVSKIRYQPNDIYLHSDESQMPRTRTAWASWNVLDKMDDGDNHGSRRICVTYWLNHLQNLPSDAPLLLCTLNPLSKVDPSKVIYKTVLDHPVFDTAAMQSQRTINEMQADPDAAANGRNIWFAGAWLGSGFHEDGIRSAVAVATALSKDGRSPPDWAKKVGAPEKPALQLIRGPSPEKTWGQSLGLKVFESLASRGIQKGYFRMILPDGNDMLFGRTSRAEAIDLKEPAVVMRVYDLALLWMCVADSDIGLGRAYRSKMFDVDDLVGLFDLLIVNNQSLRDALNPLGISTNSPIFGLIAALSYAAGNVIEHIRHLSRDNTVAGSRKNIEEHYDLGNDMYKLFLDQSMTYSCGIHTAECGAQLPEGQTELGLHEAQLAKLDAIIKRADLQPTDHVLEIGCGWGSFAIRAASTVGCRVTGITISTEQLAEAKARVKAAGLENKVNLIICDYRKMGFAQYNSVKEQILYEHDLAPGCFDKIVSIEMLEAVGHKHLPEYFETVERMLKPGGRAVVQVISLPDERYEEYCSTSDFIRECIFPGGHLPSLGAIKWAIQETALDLNEVVDIGPDYAITLRMWRETFLQNKKQILALGYPESWFRVFEMYFAYCEAGFRQKYILDYHLTFVNRSAEAAASSEDANQEERQAPSVLDNFDETILPVVVAFMSWVSILALTLDPVIRNLATVVCCAVAFSTGIATYLPKLDPTTTSVSRRLSRRSQLIFVKLCVSAFVCLVVIGLIALHDVLYTTRLANATPWESPLAVSGDAVDQQHVLNLSKVEDDLHFCNWGSDVGACSEAVTLDDTASAPAEVASTLVSSSSKYYIKSPMHFVVCVLAWASVSRFLLRKTTLNGMHALALMALTFHSYAADTKTATTALGLAIIHGVSELHACFRHLRSQMHFRGYNLSNRWYTYMWALDILSLLVIRWLPVPILLSPVILRAPWPVLLPICAIAIRETAILMQTIGQFKEEYENRVNTDQLLSKARSREELIQTMGKTVGKNNSKIQVEHHSAIFSGSVFHRRSKVEGVSPSEHQFKYKVWMALVDLEEVKRGTAFQNKWFVSADGSRNLFSFHREDHFGPRQEPLDETVRNAVFRECGQRPTGPIMVLTNLRCFGFVFNPVSIYYCLSENRSKLEAVVLEVSNTPWLERRIYVLPFFESKPTAGDTKEWFRSKWKKDFHVSPFFDVFYNYEWLLTVPHDELHVKAISTRRPGDAKENVDKPEWTHIVGQAPVDRNVEDDGQKTFIAALHLRKSASAAKELVVQPFMTFSVVLYIHLHAAILMLRKGCDYKQKPENAPYVGVGTLIHTLAVFAVASMWSLVSAPFRLLTRRRA